MKTGCAFQVSCSEFIPRFVLLCEPLALLVARGPAVGVARRPAGAGPRASPRALRLGSQRSVAPVRGRGILAAALS